MTFEVVTLLLQELVFRRRDLEKDVDLEICLPQLKIRLKLEKKIYHVSDEIALNFKNGYPM